GAVRQRPAHLHLHRPPEDSRPARDRLGAIAEVVATTPRGGRGSRPPLGVVVGARVSHRREKGSTVMNTVTAMAGWTAQLRFEQLPPEVVHQAKRVLLDSLGCALGGCALRDVQIARDVLREVAGRGPATVLGTGRRIDPVSAAFVNALMLRYLDYNDV